MPKQKIRKPRRTARRHRRSTSGKIKVPLDVSSDKDLPKFMKALKNKTDIKTPDNIFILFL